jgi:acyl dehydratase
MPDQRATALPELLYEDLSVGLRFRPLEFVASAELVGRYAEIVGDDNPLYTDAGGDAPLVPPGLWGVWGRQAYLQDHAMPAGGVLAGEDLEFIAPLRVGQKLTVQAEVTELYIRKERPRVVLEMTATDEDGRRCGLVRIHAIWPSS